MPTADAWDFSYRTNALHGADFLARVRGLLEGEARKRPLRILEVGCGDGGKAIRLAEGWPGVHVTGVDISDPSIRQARRLRKGSPARERLEFLCGDYRALAPGRFDVILADSVLQWLPGPTDALFAKLAAELNPGGFLLFSMPYDCAYNTVLTGLRRTLRLVRSRFLDRAILLLAGRLHGQAHAPEFLRERLNYMYILPERMASRDLERSLAAGHGLVVAAVLPYLHASPAQYKHRLWCCRREPWRAAAAG